MKISTFGMNAAIFLAGIGTTRAISLSKRQSATSAIGSLSPNCQSALAGIAGNQDASSCLDVPALVTSVLTLQANSSAVPTINSYLEGLCAAQPCSNATISAIAANITTGCQSDLAAAGSSLGAIVQDLPNIYPTLQKILCLTSPANNTLCVSSTLLGLQDATGSTLSLSTATDTITQLVGQATSNNLPSSVLCTDCNQAALKLVIQADAAIGSNPTFQSTINSQCGANFLNGPSPTDVVEGTGTLAPTGTIPIHLVASGNSGNSGNNTNNAAAAVAAGVFTSTALALFAGLYTVVVA